MRQEIRYLILLVIMLMSFSPAIPQDQSLLFENYSSRNGLSQNSCYDISQDERGFMWFATQDGLNRYDGHEFQVYSPDNKIGKSLPSNHITCLEFDTDEKIMWIGTARGASLYDQEIDSVVSLSRIYPFAKILETIPIRKIVHLQKGGIWIVTQNNGLIFVQLEEEKLHHYFDKEGMKDHVNGITLHHGQIVVSVSDQIYTLHSDTPDHSFKLHPVEVDFSDIKELYSFRDRLWVGTFTRGCYYIEDFGGENRAIEFERARMGGIGAFQSDRNGNLWIGTRGNGILVYQPDNGVVKEARHNIFDKRSLGKNFILSIFLDRQGIIWCGLSGGGLSKYDPLKYQFTNIHHDPLNSGSLPGNMVFDIFKGESGTYYIGTQNKGFIKWDIEDDRFHQYPYFSNPGVPVNTVYDIINDDMHSYWIATYGGLVHFNEISQSFIKYTDKTYPATRNLYALHKLRNRDSLLVASDYGMMFFSTKSKKWSPCLPEFFETEAIVGRYFLEDDDGYVWISTEGAGLVRLNYVNKKVEVIQEVLNISNNARFALKEGDRFWIATDNGIVLYNARKNEVVKHFVMDEIHHSNVSYSIQKDQAGNIWAGTNYGLLKIDTQTNRLQNYNLENGLKFLEYNTACTLAEEDGILVFGGVGGMTKFNPMDIQENSFSPDPLITSISVNNKDITRNMEEPEFGHKDNNWTFHFTANNFSNHERNRYYYKMQGLTDGWMDNRYDHTVSFNSIPPGNYAFQVRSANSDGVWSGRTASFKFVIQPPWWASWWFITLVITTIVLILGFVIIRRFRNIRNKAELKQRIVETEMMALRAQMNPHFIFNCLNSIDAFIQSNDKYKATTYLNKFARLLRNVLDSSRQNTVTFSRDFETLKLYLELEELRNGNKFTTEIHADSVLMNDDFQVPPLLIQPYVENAILHGLKYRSDNNGQLKICANKLDDKIQYIIEDNGVGRQKTKNGISKDRVSYGMKMTSDRVRYFNKEKQASVIVTDLAENGQATGTRVEVLLDLK